MTLLSPDGDLEVGGIVYSDGLSVNGTGSFSGDLDLNGFNLTNVGGVSLNSGSEFVEIVPGAV